MPPLASVATSTVMFTAGAIGDLQMPSRLNGLCWPLNESSPGLVSGTLTIVPRILGAVSPFMAHLRLGENSDSRFGRTSAEIRYYFFFSKPIMAPAGGASEPSLCLVNVVVSPWQVIATLSPSVV